MSAAVSNVKMRHKPKADSTKIDYFLEDSFYGRHWTFSANNCCDIHSVFNIFPRLRDTYIHSTYMHINTVYYILYNIQIYIDTNNVRYDPSPRTRVSPDECNNNTPRTGCNSGIRLRYTSYTLLNVPCVQLCQ